MPEFEGEITSKIVAFLREIGLSVTSGKVGDDVFLPGISVVNGGLVIDEAKLNFPGDILHEAGHLAVVPAAVRPTLSGEVTIPQTNPHVIESAAMSWSYAACTYLGLEPRVVFHESGYHGQSPRLLFNFQLGVFPGVHDLVSAGMTATNGPEHDRFPVMRRWLRD